MRKNTAGQVVSFQMLSTSDGSPVTAGTPAVYVTGDGGTQSAGTGTKTHEGNGVWSYAPLQGETNFDQIAFTMALSGAFSQTVNVYTTTPQSGDAYAVVNSGTHGNAALKILIDTINGFVDTEVAGVKSVTDKLDTALEADGPVFRFTVNALENGPAGSGPTPAAIADAVWDEAVAGHATAGTFGAKNQKAVPSETIGDYTADLSGLHNISVADIIAGISDGAYDLQQMLRIMFAALSGLSNGGGTNTINFRDAADTKNRISATVDVDGNRTAITLNGA